MEHSGQRSKGRTERRILVSPYATGFWAELATLVRGSSRRIMTVRFRPAYIRVINRRFVALNCHLLCFQNKSPAPGKTIQEPAQTNQPPSGLDRSLHIRRSASRLAELRAE